MSCYQDVNGLTSGPSYHSNSWFSCYPTEDVFPVCDQNHNDCWETLSSSSDDDDQNNGSDNDDDVYDDDNDESQHESPENETSTVNSTPTSPRRTISHESQTSTPSRPSRTSSSLSNFVWSATSRYRPFVDHSIKKMGLIKLGKRLGDILDSSVMKARQVLAPPASFSIGDECQCKSVVQEQRKLSVNYLEALLNGQNEELSQSSCSCHPHRTVRPGLANFESRIWSDEFEESGLPSFRSLYLFLSRVPLDIIHECLRLRLQHRPKGEPSSLSVRQVKVFLSSNLL